MKNLKRVTAIALAAAAVAAALWGAIAFGGPKPPPPLASINNPFGSVDFSDMPPLSHFAASDGTLLAYRYYGPTSLPAKGSIVFVHGSSASSNSMHVLAKGFASAGYAAYSLDIRGHGSSGPKGKISYIGQLENDLESFIHAVPLRRPSTLAGFSSGGGFVLRFAGSTKQDEFQSYLLLSPYIGRDAPNTRYASGGWVNVGIPRVIAISLLNSFGIRAFNDMPVISFALNQDAKSLLTPEYSFALAGNFQPKTDYEANIKSVHQPCAILAGTSDEVFYTDKLKGIFLKQGKNWPVTLLPGIGHIPLTLDPSAVAAAVKAVDGMRANGV